LGHHHRQGRPTDRQPALPDLAQAPARSGAWPAKTPKARATHETCQYPILQIKGLPCLEITAQSTENPLKSTEYKLLVAMLITVGFTHV
jgi:hypothetical protein